MESKNNFSWLTVVLLAAFCILGSFGTGISARGLAEHHGGWSLALFGVSTGIFIALSVVLLKQILAYFQDN